MNIKFIKEFIKEYPECIYDAYKNHGIECAKAEIRHIKHLWKLGYFKY